VKSVPNLAWKAYDASPDHLVNWGAPILSNAMVFTEIRPEPRLESLRRFPRPFS